MLGKRSRAQAPMAMKRTTSMTGITVDFDRSKYSDPQNQISPDQTMALRGPEEYQMMLGQSDGHDHRSSALLSPRYTADRYLQTANFLRTCGLCNRRLAPGRDIYMYRGDTAFCSQECREQQMKHDERKEKYAAASSKKVEGHLNHSELTATTGSEASGKGERIAAA